MTRGRIAFLASSLAVASGAALVAAAFTVQMYSSSPPRDGTLVAVNGLGVLVPLAVPLVLALVAFAGLHARCSRGSERGFTAAVVVLSLLAGFTLLTGFSIGLLVLPVTALVAVAVVLTPGA